LEKVYIEKVILKNVVPTYHQFLAMYVDKMNTMYNESELVTYEEALQLVDLSTLMIRPLRTKPKEEKKVVSVTVEPSFVRGQILYSKSASLLGQMERIVIKSMLSPGVYQDLTNGLWNEDELISEESAKSFALTYWLERKNQIENAMRRNPSAFRKVNDRGLV
jgi:hypothetical protein